MSKKNAILLNATRLFSKKGYTDTSMAEVAKIAGAAGGTIFYHFKTKEELFLSILHNVKETIISDFKSYREDNEFKSGLEMVEKVISFYLNLAKKREDQFRLLHRHYPYELAVANPVCREHLVAIYDCFVDMFEQAIERGKNDGTIFDLPVKKTALIIFSMVDGLARFNTYHLYDAGTLYNAVIESCRRMLKNDRPQE
jgi:AcrR family transcriptional regulator